MSDHTIYEAVLTDRGIRILGSLMMTLATGFIIARFTIRGIKGRFFLWEETSITIAWICMIVVCSNNIVLTAPMNRVAALAREEVPYYQELLSDFQLAITRVFANGLVFWTCLWSVKIALMLQCKRLVERRPTYTLIWWCIVSFIILSYLGCYVVHFTICDNFKSMFNFPGCTAESFERRKAMVFYYTYSVDIITDLMIIIFPIPVLYRLTLNRVRKINILGIFGVGTICICVATICFAQPASKHPGKCPGPLWLAIWSTVESAIAVVVGCLPTFGLLLPPIRSTSDPPYFHHGNNKKHSRSLSGTLESTLRDHSVDLRSSTSRVALGRLDSCNHGHGYMVTANDSKDRITWPFPGVMVTNTFEVDEPTLDALPPVTLPPQPSHQQGIP